ncbi:MAG: phosphotransferase [Kocuria palustris]|nr:phosphotransferase [Kocuria palustris]
MVFTHSDFSSRNILVDENNDYQVTAILDWEFAGWYPEWWEYFRAYKSFHRGKDWSDYLCYILPPRFEREFIGMCYVSEYCSS